MVFISTFLKYLFVRTVRCLEGVWLVGFEHLFNRVKGKPSWSPQISHLVAPTKNSSPPEHCEWYFAGLLEWIWRSDGSLVSSGYVPIGGRPQLMWLYLTTSLRQSCLVGNNSAWILLGCQPDLLVCWNASLSYPSRITHHRLLGILRHFPGVLLSYYPVVLFAATAPHEPSHSSVEAMFGHSSYPAWYSFSDQNQYLSRAVSVALRDVIQSMLWTHRCERRGDHGDAQTSWDFWNCSSVST